MKNQTATEKTVARLRVRRARLADELATIDRMLSAADGKPAGTWTVVGPLVPMPPMYPPTTVPLIQPIAPYHPHYPPTGVTGPFPGFPFGSTIVCASGDTAFAFGTRIESMPSIPVGIGASTLVVTAATGSH